MTSKLSVLAVDDDDRNLRILAEIFESDYDLYYARNGQEALEMVAKVKPDIMLLDIMMPEIDGLEVCRRVKSKPELSNTKIILVSARALPDERAAGYAAGADQYITKPFDHGELMDILSSMNME